jgi:hypothetical protein
MAHVSAEAVCLAIFPAVPPWLIIRMGSANQPSHRDAVG